MAKIKLYLDTNIIIDFFINEARVFSKAEEPRIPKKFEFMAEKSAEIDFITSVITKAEVARELVSSYGMKKEEIEPVWNRFIDAVDCTVIETVTIDSRLTEIAFKTKMRIRTMFNLIHVFIAMENNAYFLSGDKDIVDKVRKNGIYDKVLSYKELRQRFG